MAFFVPPVTACFMGFFLFVGRKCRTTVLWEGPGKVWLRFLVVDAWAGQPIHGAKVVLFGPNDTRPSPEVFTGPEGTASLVVACPVLVEKGLFGASTSAYLVNWSFKVTAAGYEGSGRESLAWYTVWNKGVENPDPPPIRVELMRLPAAVKG
jgi:hypothetical protein